MNTVAQGAPIATPAAAHAILTAPGAPFETQGVVIRGIPMRVWKNAPATLRDVFLASQAFQERDFLVFEGERATYAGFGKAVARLANDLVRRGLERGDRVALVMRNTPQWPVAFFASAISGAIVAPLNPALAKGEIFAALADCGAKVALFDADLAEMAQEALVACPALKTIYVTEDGAMASPGVRALQDIIGPVGSWADGEAPDLPMVTLAADDDATLFYTSGTTGLPKGVVGSHRNMISAIRTNAIAQARATLMAGRDFVEADPHQTRPTTNLLVFGLSHVTACCNSLVPLMMRGGKIVMMRRWSVEGALQLVGQERINAIGGAPTIVLQLLGHPARDRYDLSSLKYVLFGGAPSSPDLSRQVGQALKATPFCGYGMTETSASFTNLVGGEYLAHPDSCGPAAPVGEICIRSLDGQTPLPVGEIGEIWLKGPQIVRGYWNRPDETASTFVDGWVRTGDIGRLDGDGYLYIVDRAKDVIIRGGENIYCIEVENALKSHPAVADAAVVGIPHAMFGEEPVAVVVLHDGARAEERALRIFVRSRLAAFKTPVRVFFSTEPLPRNAGGKVAKAALREMFGS